MCVYFCYTTGRDIDTYIDIVHRMHPVDIRIDRQCRTPQCTFHRSCMGSICRALVTIKTTNTFVRYNSPADM